MLSILWNLFLAFSKAALLVLGILLRVVGIIAVLIVIIAWIALRKKNN